MLSHNVIGACIDVQRELGLHPMEVDYQLSDHLALHYSGWNSSATANPSA
jgi:hypothetical protein